MTDSSNPRRRILRKIASADFEVEFPLPLPIADIDLWHVDLDATAHGEPRWRGLLSTDECERANRFHFERDRSRYGTTRAILRILLAGYLNAKPGEVEFCYSKKGKPELAEPHRARGLAFNVSHSGAAALLGFSRRKQIGVDVEWIRSNFDTDAIAKRFFSAREQEQLFRVPADRRHIAFFRCWTLKEAFIKALGEGLSHPLHQFDVSLDVPADESTLVPLTTRPRAEEAARWSLQTVELGDGYAAACAVSIE